MFKRLILLIFLITCKIHTADAGIENDQEILTRELVAYNTKDVHQFDDISKLMNLFDEFDKIIEQVNSTKEWDYKVALRFREQVENQVSAYLKAQYGMSNDAEKNFRTILQQKADYVLPYMHFIYAHVAYKSGDVNKTNFIRYVNGSRKKIAEDFYACRADLRRIAEINQRLVEELWNAGCSIIKYPLFVQYAREDYGEDDKKICSLYMKINEAYNGNDEALSYLINKRAEKAYSLALAIILERNRRWLMTVGHLDIPYEVSIDSQKRKIIDSLLDYCISKGDKWAEAIKKSNCFNRDSIYYFREFKTKEIEKNRLPIHLPPL